MSHFFTEYRRSQKIETAQRAEYRGLRRDRVFGERAASPFPTI